MSILRFALLEGMPGSRLSDAARRLRREGAKSSSSIGSTHLRICETLESSALEGALQLVRRRLEPLVMSPRSFDAARSVALGALRERQRAPVEAGLDRARQLAFQELGTISHPPLGTVRGLAKVQMSDVHALYGELCNVERVVTIAGDIDERSALEMARRILGAAREEGRTAAGRALEPTPPSDELRILQRNERFSTERIEQLELPHVIYAWALPTQAERAAADFVVQAVNRQPTHPAFSKLLGHGGPLHELHARLISDDAPFLLAIDFKVRSGPAGDVDKARKLLAQALVRLGEAAEPEREPREESPPDDALRRAIVLSTQVLSPESTPTRRVSVAHLVNSRLTPQRQTTIELYPTRWRMDPPPRIVHRTHEVRKGDTLIGIAKRYGASVRDIAKANGLRRRGFIYPGQELIVPIHNKPPGSRQATYEVRRGDSLSVIAARHQVTTAALRAANGLAEKALIRTGQTLKIPPSNKPKRRTIVVKKGDSWIRLAKQHQTTPRELANENGRSTKSKLFLGEELYLPHRKPQ